MNVYSQGGARRVDAGRTRVGLFVDGEVLREAGFGAGASMDPGEAAGRLQEIAREEGRVILACAYADWSDADHDPRPFRRQGVDTRLVLPGEDGKGRAWLVLGLDVIESLFAEPRIDTYVLAGASPELEEVLKRLRRFDRRIVLCSGDASSAPDPASLADRFARLDEVLGPGGFEAEGAMDFEKYDWAPFIRALSWNEKRMEFIGIGLLLKKILDQRNCGHTSYNRKREIFEKAKELGVIEIYTVPNIDEGGDPVSACRLNRNHDVVRRVLSLDDEERKDAGAAEPCKEPGAAP